MRFSKFKYFLFVSVISLLLVTADICEAAQPDSLTYIVNSFVKIKTSKNA